MTSRTREQAKELVDDLLQAAREYEVHHGRKSYREHYQEMKERVVNAMADDAEEDAMLDHPDAGGKSYYKSR